MNSIPRKTIRRGLMIASALLLLFQQTLVLAGEETFRWAHFIGPILFFLSAYYESPRRHPLVPRYEHHGIRRCVHADYLIFCRVGTELVEVIHILHGAQDYEPLLFPNA